MGKAQITMMQKSETGSPGGLAADLSVSVILPCFNCEKYVRRTIESVLSQDYPNLEVIAVDDGSTDGTLEILKSFTDRIRIFTHAGNRNLGQSATTNLGIEKSSADIIAFIDNDDIWFPGKLAKQIEVLRERADVGVVYCGAIAIAPDDQVLYEFPTTKSYEENTPSQLLLDCHIQTPSQIAVRRSCLARVGGFDESLVPADHDMWLRLIELTRFQAIDEPLVGYRKHPNQLSLVRERQMWKDGFRVLAKACERYPYPSKVVRRRKAVLHYRLARHDRMASKYARALAHYLRVVYYDPRRTWMALLTVVLLSVALD